MKSSNDISSERAQIEEASFDGIRADELPRLRLVVCFTRIPFDETSRKRRFSAADMVQGPHFNSFVGRHLLAIIPKCVNCRRTGSPNWFETMKPTAWSFFSSLSFCVIERTERTMNDHSWPVNPASGLPMIGGGVDVGGNAFGTARPWAAPRLGQSSGRPLGPRASRVFGVVWFAVVAGLVGLFFVP